MATDASTNPPPSNESAPPARAALPQLVELESLSPDARVEGDATLGFTVVHPYGRERYDSNGQSRSERNAAHAALPASTGTVAQYPLRLVFEQSGRRRALAWTLKIKAPEQPPVAAPIAPTPAAPPRFHIQGDVRVDTAEQNPNQDWSDGFNPGSSRSACGQFTLHSDGRWEYELNTASPSLEAVKPGLMLQETFKLNSRRGTRCEVNLSVTPLADTSGHWVLTPNTQLL